MNAISNVMNAYKAYASRESSAPSQLAELEDAADFEAQDAYDASAIPEEMPGLAELDSGDEFAPFSDEAAPLEAVAEAAATQEQELEERLGPPAAEVNGEMWFFSAGPGCCEDGGGGDWGGVAGLDL